MLELTVVIPVYGPGPHLERVVSALKRQTSPVGLIIISHSGGDDPSNRFVGVDGVTVLHSPRRLYAGAARNRGLALATTEWVAFVDEDVIVDDHWHSALMQAISRGEADCIVGALADAGTGRYWGTSLWYMEFGSVHPYLTSRAIPNGPSANIAMRRKEAVSAGGFPEDWSSAEELLLQARMRKHGLEVRFVRDVIGRHINVPGFLHMLSHGYLRGRGSAQLRRACPELRGSDAVRWPFISAGLWAARMGQIYWRVFAAREGPRISLLAHTPGILMAVLAWNAGFTAGAFRARRAASIGEE